MDELDIEDEKFTVNGDDKVESETKSWSVKTFHRKIGSLDLVRKLQLFNVPLVLSKCL